MAKKSLPSAVTAEMIHSGNDPKGKKSNRNGFAEVA
jgi:hypothetical protein